MDYDPADREICSDELRELKSKTIEVPEALDKDALNNISEGDVTAELEKLCDIVFKCPSGSFTCRAWMNIFTINEPVVQEYVWEFLASVDFDEEMTIMTENCLFFQLGGVRREMTMRQSYGTLF